MKHFSKYLILIFALCLSGTVFGQFQTTTISDQSEFGSDTADLSERMPERREIAKREGGSANSGIVYYFYENLFNVGLPNLRFIDTVKTLFQHSGDSSRHIVYANEIPDIVRSFAQKRLT